MSLNNEYFITSLIIQVASQTIYPDRYCRGIISRKMRKLFRWPDNFFLSFAAFRIGQMTLLALLQNFIIIHVSNNSFYWIGIIILFLDDAFFGDDDDRWKRRWQAVKNKIKWKMVLPKPQTAQASS